MSGTELADASLVKIPCSATAPSARGRPTDDAIFMLNGAVRWIEGLRRQRDMAGVEFTAMDFALLQRLYALREEQPEGLTPAELRPLVQEDFPESDHAEMREGISITRLRGRGLIEDSPEGRVKLTDEGVALAAGLET